MNKDLTEIAFILDRSGSMASVAPAAISGFNEFLREQQAAPGQARLTLVLFDDEYLVPVTNVLVQKVAPLNSDTYVPRNTTALLDAIGQTIERLGQRLEQTPEPDRPGKVIVAILTDGLENSSKTFSREEIAEVISHQTQVYNWDFLFLGANQDAIATAANLNIDAANAAAFAHDSVGTHSLHMAVSRKASAIRAKASGRVMDSDEESAYAAPMSNLVKEEDHKERQKK